MSRRVCIGPSVCMSLPDTEIAKLLEANKQSLKGPDDQALELKDAETSIFGAGNAGSAEAEVEAEVEPPKSSVQTAAPAVDKLAQLFANFELLKPVTTQDKQPTTLSMQHDPEAPPKPTQVPDAPWVDDGRGIATNRADGNGITGRKIAERKDESTALPVPTAELQPPVMTQPKRLTTLELQYDPEAAAAASPPEPSTDAPWVDDGRGIATNRADGNGITARMIRRRQEFDRELPSSIKALFMKQLLNK